MCLQNCAEGNVIVEANVPHCKDTLTGRRRLRLCTWQGTQDTSDVTNNINNKLSKYSISRATLSDHNYG